MHQLRAARQDEEPYKIAVRKLREAMQRNEEERRKHWERMDRKLAELRNAIEELQRKNEKFDRDMEEIRRTIGEPHEWIGALRAAAGMSGRRRKCFLGGSLVGAELLRRILLLLIGPAECYVPLKTLGFLSPW